MKKNIFAGILICGLTAYSCGDSDSAKWKSYSGDSVIEYKVDSVLSLMTLEEKIGQMTQFSSHGDITGPVVNEDIAPYLRKGMVGSIFNAVTVDGIRKLQDEALSESRLKIPVLFGYDVVHGFKTIFPMPLAESCSWDLPLMRRTAEIAAEEAASAGIAWTFAPMVDIARDARWGRVMEGAGEDPYLGALIAEARVKGFQGETWKDLSSLHTVLACAKHFCAYGAAEAGRDYNTVDVSDRTLRDIYFPPFEAANKAGVATFMTAFNEISGIPSTASNYLFTDILRKEWGFKGFVVTDYTAINELIPHGVAADEKQAAELSANAGIEMDMTGGVFLHNLAELVKEGRVSEKMIDNAVRRILEMKFILGLFDDPYRYADKEREKATIMKPEFLQTAREAGKRSIVLLKNDNSFFPIKKERALKVALIGPMVKNKTSLNGEWAGRGDRNQSVSLYEGLTEKYKESAIRFVYAEGCDIKEKGTDKFAEALQTARQADIIIAAMGEDYNWSGEAACRTNIQLPGSQQDLLKELKKTGKPIGLLVMSGRPLDLSWENANVDAIMETWYLGTMAGHSMADVICGDYNPSGKLTMSFPRNVGQLPIYYNHKNTGRPLPPERPKEDYKSSYLDVENTPLYPFGYGLSYTRFLYSTPSINAGTLKKGGELKISITVTNTGNYDGEEVTQLYVQDVTGSVTRPVKELKGFNKQMIKRGESISIEFTLKESDLAFIRKDNTLGTEPGEYRVYVGGSSEEVQMVSFTLQ